MGGLSRKVTPYVYLVHIPELMIKEAEVQGRNDSDATPSLKKNYIIFIFISELS